jgi:RNA recognition motif-containing protein
MPDEYLPPNKILFLQNLPDSVTKDQLMALFSQYPNLHEVRLIPTKKDIAFVEYMDEGSATVAKDALHNYKLDGENKIKVRLTLCLDCFLLTFCIDYFRKKVRSCLSCPFALSLFSCMSNVALVGVIVWYRTTLLARCRWL